MRFLIVSIILVNLFSFQECAVVGTDSTRVLLNRSKPKPIDNEDADVPRRNHIRTKRYLGLNKKLKLNKQYQECIGPGDVKGHCKHLTFCPIDVLQGTKNALEYLCVIEKTFVGVCCPDDIALKGSIGSQLIMDLPAGGEDYDETDTFTGCGIPADGRSATNTKPTTIQEWPWLAALFRPEDLADGYEQQFCGGSVITDSHILTAAHCLQSVTPQEIRVRLGEYDFSKPNETRYRDHEVAQFISHQDFVTGSYENDIGIVRLTQPTTFNSYIWPICLPPTGVNYENDLGVVAGWGHTYFGGPTSEVLLQVAIPIWNLKECADKFLHPITETNLCAASYEGGKDSCQGDSGGPLMYQLPNKRWIVAGVVSWGIECGNKDNPGVYTRVDKYLPWIIQNTIAKE
ncbi:hypothetical protein GWI33_018409 [Rhynchophorus ferrugineus]|uniref:Phenoloxidase-activating factor 2 n=1 Tax=Rhynchophorus ferrugineus TaxID=354439 RepID=A0A834HXA4_RHYFE|nr:hypothetical protein GWI33_018409 [Rhynchophorus ferrugineus]